MIRFRPAVKRARHLVEYALARAAFALLDALSPAAATRLAAAAGRVWYTLAAARRRVAIDNILRTGIATDRPAAAGIARASFRHLAIMAVEALKAPRLITPENWRDYAVLVGDPAAVESIADPSRPAIVATAHLGNWEVGAMILSFVKPFLGIVRRMNNPYVDRLLQSRTSRNQLQVVAKQDVEPGDLMGALRRGANLAFMIDQRAHKRGREIPFFGRPARTHCGIALVHLTTGVPIYFGYGLRTGPLRYEIHLEGPFTFARTGHKDADIAAVIATLNGRLEAAIRRHPDQYLWLHRRWKQTAAPRNGTRSGAPG